LEVFQVKFDSWFNESSLYEKDLIQKSIKRLKSNEVEKKDGALWFKSTNYGDEKDRVLIRDNDEPTYFASDIAYHKDKYERDFDELINIWGADHHGYIPRVKASIESLGLDSKKLKTLLIQFVSLKEKGKKVQMSTRSGEFVELSDLVDEVGIDSARYYFLARKPEQALEFDIDLAKKTNKDKIKIVQSKIDASKIGKNVKLVAVSKKKSWQDILKAYENGISDFGENYLQESLEKISKLKDLKISWHFIGNIQSNKCEEIAKNFDWVHTVDRLKIARLIDKYCPDDKCIKCLIQINIDNEESKSGIRVEEVENFLNELSDLKKIKICGLMIIPNPNVALSDLKQTFKKIKMLTDRLIENYENLTEISMGMSRDFELAIKEGSTIVRLGETIFGARN